jgi:predicted permease
MEGEIALRALPVFVIIALGYGAGRMWKVSPETIKHLTNITIFFFLPSLIFTKTLEIEFGSQVWTMIIAALFIVLIVGTVSYFLSRGLNLENGKKNSFLLGTMFMNAGSMGTSVALFAFGSEAFLLAVVFYLTVQMLLYTLGVFIASDGAFNLRALKPVFTLPLVYALLLGVGFSKLGINMDAVLGPFSLMAGAAIPLLLITLGLQLSSVKPSFSSLPIPSMATGIRIVLGFSAALAFVALVGLDGMERNVVLVSASMPTAITTFIIGSKFNTDTNQISQQILLSTVISIFTVPLILFGLSFG